jgi:hypothetical protein
LHTFHATKTVPEGRLFGREHPAVPAVNKSVAVFNSAQTGRRFGPYFLRRVAGVCRLPRLPRASSLGPDLWKIPPSFKGVGRPRATQRASYGTAPANQGDRMPSYKFKVHSIGFEKLGAAVLADDDEALGFAQRIISELVQCDAIFATATMEITAGKRGVARITFESRSKKVWVAAGAATL